MLVHLFSNSRHDPKSALGLGCVAVSRVTVERSNNSQIMVKSRMFFQQPQKTVLFSNPAGNGVGFTRSTPCRYRSRKVNGSVQVAQAKYPEFKGFFKIGS
jgi:hypothetical protein